MTPIGKALKKAVPKGGFFGLLKEPFIGSFGRDDW